MHSFRKRACRMNMIISAEKKLPKKTGKIRIHVRPCAMPPERRLLSAHGISKIAPPVAGALLRGYIFAVSTPQKQYPKQTSCQVKVFTIAPPLSNQAPMLKTQKMNRNAEATMSEY